MIKMTKGIPWEGLRLQASTAGGRGSIPGQGTNMSPISAITNYILFFLDESRSQRNRKQENNILSKETKSRFCLLNNRISAPGLVPGPGPHRPPPWCPCRHAAPCSQSPARLPERWLYYRRRRRSSVAAQTGKSLPAMKETWVRLLGWEDPLDKGMASHSTISACTISWTEEPGGLWPMGSQGRTQLSNWHLTLTPGAASNTEYTAALHPSQPCPERFLLPLSPLAHWPPQGARKTPRMVLPQGLCTRCACAQDTCPDTHVLYTTYTVEYYSATKKGSLCNMYGPCKKSQTQKDA